MSLANINAVAKMSVFLEWFFLDVVLSPIVVVLLAIHSHLANHFLHRSHFLPSFLAYFYLPISFISTYTRTDRQRHRKTDRHRERQKAKQRDRYATKQWFYWLLGTQEMVNQARRKWSINLASKNPPPSLTPHQKRASYTFFTALVFLKGVLLQKLLFVLYAAGRLLLAFRFFCGPLPSGRKQNGRQAEGFSLSGYAAAGGRGVQYK